MKNLLSFLFLISLMGFTTIDYVKDKGKVLESLSMESKLLKRSVNFSVYFPPGYDENQREYPILYLLHGYTDNETAWVQFGEVNRYADQAIEEGSAPPMIIVMPDAAVTWYINDHEGKIPYEDFFVEEFIPHIETSFKVRKDKQFRGISGLSMGGYGALLYAMKHPDLFVASAPLSGAFYLEKEVIEYEQGRWDSVEGLMYGKNLVGEERITEHWKANNPFYLADKIGAESLKKVRYYFDCGDDDFLYKGNAGIHVKFREMGVPHEFRIRDGAHNWNYWRTGITDVLKFMGESFRR